MVWIVTLMLLFLFQMATILLAEFRKPSKAVAWLVVLLIFPVIGFIMYYFLAQDYSHRRMTRRRKGRRVVDPRFEHRRYAASEAASEGEAIELGREAIFQEPRLFALLNNIESSVMTRHNEVTVLTNAEATYERILKAIDEARAHIHLQYYIMRDDRIGRTFQEALIRKAREGVQVRCIFDGVGSYKLDDRFIEPLKEAGVQVSFFFPALIAFFDKRMNYRNHRKIVIVDGVKGYVGGINIGEEYVGGDPDLGFWRDTHLELVGDSVYALQTTFLSDWHLASGQRVVDHTLYPEHTLQSRKLVQVLTSGPDANWDAILEMYFGAITSAKKRVYITTPYFIPDPSITMALKMAAVSGVDVRIVFPSRSDTRIVQYASIAFFEELMQAGVRFFAYERGFIHAKVLLIDDILASVGTANMDMRSFFSNFELNAVLFDKESIRRLESDFLHDLRDCREWRLEAFQNRSRWQKGKEIVARLLSPLF